MLKNLVDETKNEVVAPSLQEVIGGLSIVLELWKVDVRKCY
jgi:hypothetical protein